MDRITAVERRFIEYFHFEEKDKLFCNAGVHEAGSSIPLAQLHLPNRHNFILADGNFTEWVDTGLIWFNYFEW